MEKQITKIFNQESKIPFHYKIEFTDIENIEELFKQIYTIYKIGLCTLYGKNKTIDLRNINFKRLEKMKQYMLSLGIEVLHYRLTKAEETNLYKHLLTELESIEDLKLYAKYDWRTQYIINIELIIQKDTKNLNKIIDILNNNKKICRTLNFFNLKNKIDLDDFCEKIIIDNEIHIISFKIADTSVYGLTVNQVLKYKCKK